MTDKDLIERLRELLPKGAADTAIKTLLAEREAENQPVYQAAIDKWGAFMQTVVAIEELSELQKELCKSIRGTADKNHIAEEIADVEIMLEQLKLLYGVRDTVNAWRKLKLDRLALRVKDDAQSHCH